MLCHCFVFRFVRFNGLSDDADYYYFYVFYKIISMNMHIAQTRNGAPNRTDLHETLHAYSALVDTWHECGECQRRK